MPRMLLAPALAVLLTLAWGEPARAQAGSPAGAAQDDEALKAELE
ncbi:MAG: hypothetical protein NVS4B10_09470 [Myxococcales bacterium]